MSLVVGVTKDYQGDVDFDPRSQSTTALNDVNLYVDGVNGNDNNSGSQSAPLKTLAAALALVPPSNAKSSQVTLIPGSVYQWPLGNFFPPAPIGPKASPLAIVGGLSAPLANGVETIGGDTAKLSGAVLVPNTLRGKMARVTTVTSPAFNNLAHITGNDATSVTLCQKIGNVAVNDTWEVVDTSVEVDFQEGNSAIVGGIIGFSKVKLADPTFGNAAVAFSDVAVDMGSCNTEGLFGWFMPDGTLLSALSGSFSGTWDNNANSPFAAPTAGSLYTFASSISPLNNSIVRARIVGDTSAVGGAHNSTMLLFDTNLVGSEIQAAYDTMIRFFATAPGVVPQIIDGDFFGDGFLVAGDINSTVFAAAGGPPMTLQNSSGTGLFLDRGSYARANFAGVNTGPGIELNRMARATIPASNTVTGSSDVFFDGSGAAKTYGAGTFVDPVDLSQATHVV
jgi:hypothetical protein